jgi:hypothetical protein
MTFKKCLIGVAVICGLALAIIIEKIWWSYMYARWD